MFDKKIFIYISVSKFNLVAYLGGMGGYTLPRHLNLTTIDN